MKKVQLDEITSAYIGTAREIRSLYKNLSERWIAGRSNWDPLYADDPVFKEDRYYGLCVVEHPYVSYYYVVNEHVIAGWFLLD